MAEEKFTRCPGCRTIFRVTDAQLALREGQVRCGHCQTVFNGVEQLISLALAAPRRPDPELDDAAMGPPTVTLRNSRALGPVIGQGAEAPHARGPDSIAPRTSFPPAPPPPEEPEPDYEHRFAWEKPKPRRRTGVYAVAIALLFVALAGQALFHFSASLAAYRPGTRPALTRICSVLGCNVGPLRDIDALMMSGSDLLADPAHKGLLILAATVRNQASYPIAYPHLQLTLTDIQGRVVVQRVLSPADYASALSDPGSGIPGDSEVQIKLFIDASATTQAGYLLYPFYL
jgi:predicted Zn finger-like uncharacterized protein